MQRIGAIFLFYKPLFMWSFLINLFLIIITPHIFITILTKLLLLLLILNFLDKNSSKPKLLVYEHLNISSLKLFTVVFILDTIMTVTSLNIIKEFI